VDDRFQWGEAGNIGLSAPIRSSFYMPLYVIKKALQT